MSAGADELAGLTSAAGQVWPAFALVTGLLLVGVVAERDGLFRAAGGLLARLPLGGRSLLVVAFALVALVTAILNLHTSVFFLTPVLVHLARRRGLDERGFLYGAVFMSNSASLFLPGSNLTNLIVLHGEHVSGATFFARTWAAALAAAVSTAAALLLIFWRPLGGHGRRAPDGAPFRIGVGAAAVTLSAVLVLVLRSPALPVLGVGIVAILVSRPGLARVTAAVDVRVLGLLFALAVGLGALGRAWHSPASLVDEAGRPVTAGLAALASVLVNNLPASVLLTPSPPVHARALLLGLNLGPNLAVTGSLSALLWLRVARSLGCKPSVAAYSQIGAVLVPVSLAAALAASYVS
ncbi:MAG: SLC13 family permease [Gaiellaceae bacterium]